MVLKFKDGTTKACSNPIEHRLLRDGSPVGWICTVKILENMSMEEIDQILTNDNISELIFCNRLSEELFTLSGYQKVINVIIRHPGARSEIEVQFEKSI